MDLQDLELCELNSRWKAVDAEGNIPVSEAKDKRRVSGVPRDTRNLVGKREDHLLRLNTTW